MALGKDRRRINVKAGGNFQVRELSPSPTDAWSNLGVIESFELNDEGQMIDIPDAEGNMLDYLSGLRRVGFKLTIMQTSKEEIDIIKNADGKYYDGYYSVYLVGTSQYQEYSFCLMKFKPGPVMNFAAATKRTIILEGVALAPKAAFTETPTSFNVVANQPFVIVEGGSAVGPPSGTASTKATAII